MVSLAHIELAVRICRYFAVVRRLDDETPPRDRLRVSTRRRILKICDDRKSRLSFSELKPSSRDGKENDNDNEKGKEKEKERVPARCCLLANVDVE